MLRTAAGELVKTEIVLVVKVDEGTAGMVMGP
jgi:hypothetical protein